MILFFYGPDTFRSRAHMRATIDAFKQKRDPQGYNTNVFDATKAEPAAIINALVTAPFLAEKKMVVIENCVASKNEILLGELERRIDENKIGDDVVLLIWEGEGRLTGDLFKLLKKQQFVQEFAALDRDQCIGWIAEQFRTHDMTVSTLVASKLADVHEGDLHALSNVIAQLTAYVCSQGRTQIAPDDVSWFLPPTYDDNTFHFVDALGARQQKEAMSLLEDQWQSGKTPFEIIGALLWKWRSLISIATYVESNPQARAADIAKTLKLHPFVVEKTMRALRALSIVELLSQYEELMMIDAQSKRGGNATALLELFTIKHSK